MQRITRYPLLIGQIIRYTDQDHADYSPLKKAQRSAEAILNTTNEAIRSRENKERLKVISETLFIGNEAVSMRSGSSLRSVSIQSLRSLF